MAPDIVAFGCMPPEDTYDVRVFGCMPSEDTFEGRAYISGLPIRLVRTVHVTYARDRIRA
jgi:hypothetical protein